MKATINSRRRIKTLTGVVAYGILALFSVAMSLYDFVTGRTFFGILFLVAAVIFAVLLTIRANAVLSTYIKLEDGVLTLKSWATDFLPYDVNGGFFSDMKPARTKVAKIDPEDITLVLLGTKDYIKRNATESGKKFMKALFPYEHTSRKSKKNMISSIDLLYLETDGDCEFMCVHDYDTAKVSKILKELKKLNPQLTIKVSSREYKRHIANDN